MNSITCDVEFPYGTMKEYSANINTETMLTQDSDGYTMPMMEGIIDHKIDAARVIPKRDKYITTRCGQSR